MRDVRRRIDTFLFLVKSRCRYCGDWTTFSDGACACNRDIVELDKPERARRVRRRR